MYATAGNLIKRIAKRCDRQAVPRHVAARFRQIDESGFEAVRQSLHQHFFARFADGYLSTADGQRDLMNHLVRRLENDRNLVIPWLDASLSKPSKPSKSLRGMQVLEIGCGTGCSTVALAEQGTRVVAVDLDKPALHVARERCEVYGLDVEFHLANATEVHKLFPGRRFDLVVFHASLEHMVYQERLSAIKTIWDMLSPDDLCCIVDTPNRLWYFDSHTSMLPFFSWLPDELALEYSRFSPRSNFREVCGGHGEDKQLDFLRQGRGVSFHEFHLAIGRPPEQLNVIGSLAAYLRQRSVWRRWQRRSSLKARFESVLSEVYPGLHRAWLQPSLDLIIRK